LLLVISLPQFCRGDSFGQQVIGLCTSAGGTWDSSVRGGQCLRTNSNSGGSGYQGSAGGGTNDNGAANAAAAAAAAQRAADQHAADLARQQAFENEKQKAFGTLKGVDLEEGGLKGTGGNTEMLGIKDSVDLDDSGLKTAHAQISSPGRTAWQQLTCSASIMHAGLGRLLNKKGPLSDVDAADLRYAEGQARNAVDGAEIEVGCDPGPNLKFKSASIPPSKAKYVALLNSVEREVADLIATSKEVSRDSRKAAVAQKRVDDLTRQLRDAEQNGSGNDSPGQPSPTKTPAIQTLNVRLVKAIETLQIDLQNIDEAHSKNDRDRAALGNSDRKILNWAGAPGKENESNADKTLDDDRMDTTNEQAIKP
jgi:hypothetical protein